MSRSDRWYVAVSVGVVALVVGGVVLYGVVDDDPQAGLMLVLGAFIVSLGVTLLTEDIRRLHRRRDDN